MSRTSERRGEAPRRILLVDCDMFYVQVARLEDPEGAGRQELLIVGGSPSGRGVVTSASYQVRARGVHSGMPTAQALRLCPEAVVVPVSRRACLARSREVAGCLRRLSPVVQAASIDEFYLDLSGTERLLRHEPLEATALRVRDTVLAETRISVSIGGGTRKIVAKVAARRAKPGGVHLVPPGEEESFMAGLQLRDLPGVGPALAAALERRGMVRVADLLPVEERWLAEWFGEARGQWLWERARGIDPSPVVPREPRKSVSSERTFAGDVHEHDLLEGELLRLAGAVGEALRKGGLRGRTVTVKIRDADFRTRQASLTLREPVESDATLYERGRELLARLRRQRRGGVRLLGLGISNLVEGGAPLQLELFREESPLESERRRTLSRVVDDIRVRFGEEAIRPGRMLEEEP